MAQLSVILPVYNVEAYLRECLDSLARQTHRDLEVVMVNDGSTDRSAEIAAGMAERDPRFRLVHQDNHGLGHARNTGARLAAGDFITFVDSDDVVPHYAFRTVVRTLEETGSDFLSGNEYRLDLRGAHPAPMLESNFAVTRLRTNVAKRPALLRDLLPHNKVYRKAFWDASGLEFPEGILFEDGPVSVRAHALAKSVDIVSTPIYYWRLRDDANRSLSQLVDDERFFVDRIYASTLSGDFLAAHRPDLLREFYSWDLQHKFTVMYKSLPQAPDAVQRRFLESAVPHLRRVPAEVIRRLPPALQRRVELTLAGDLATLLAELPNPAATPKPAPRSTVVRGVRGLLAKSRTARTLRAYAQIRPADGVVRSSVTDLAREGDRLRVRGYGHIARLPANGRLTAANRVLWARHQDSRKLVRLRLRSVSSPEATAASGDAYFSYRRAGFDATLRLADLKDGTGAWRYGSWLLALGALTARGVARGGLKMGVEAYRTDPTPITLDADTRLIPTVTNGVLGFRIEQSGVTLEECRLDGQVLTLSGRIAGTAEPAATVVLGRVNGVPEHEVPVEWLADRDDGHARFTARVTARVPLADLLVAVSPVAPAPVAGIPDRLSVGLRTGELAWRQFVCEPDFIGLSATVTDHHVLVQPAGDGYLAVTVRPPGPIVDSAVWTADGQLRLSGSGADQVRGFQLIGRHSSNTERRVLPSTSNPDGTWHAQFDPERVPLIGAATALRAGQWRLVLRITDRAGNRFDTDVPYAPQIFPDAGNRIAHPDGRYWVKRVRLDGLALRVNSRLAESERGSYHHNRMRERVYLRNRSRLREAVAYDSFNGKQYSDAPRAVHEAFLARDADLAHTWVTRDGQAPVPEGTGTVEANSRAWFEALATSRYIVANTHLPPWIRRRPGQVIAQTWHGIGFKRVAFDMDSVQFANPTYLDKLAEEAPNWSFLVSPSSFCTEIMRRAFRYEGEIAEIGSPRNDLLFTADRAAITDRVRRTVGVPGDRKILLYAPTWRDNVFYGPGRYKFDMRLDVSQFPPEFQREYALLVRRHPNTVDDLLGHDSDFVFDVANYPDVRDLLVAAEVLVTDYSTISLDFLNTGRPVLFYTYDLASYRDNLRGFYFDLEGEGPGPVLETTDQVVAALGDLDAVAHQYRDRYERFRQIYCHAEDGHATDRLIDRLLATA